MCMNVCIKGGKISSVDFDNGPSIRYSGVGTKHVFHLVAKKEFALKKKYPNFFFIYLQKRKFIKNYTCN